MKNLKILLPMLAFIFAIGMAFATIGVEADPLNDYIQRNGVWEAIPEQESCGEGQLSCRVIKNGEGPFNVYDSKDVSSMKFGNGDIIVLP